ncbi:hypothetical protein [Nocardia brevicatena]|uniref:hypothetical protein n=1 Tax=Nocardia brevicatena TaxID=37327 RepID=UPI003F6851ED
MHGPARARDPLRLGEQPFGVVDQQSGPRQQFQSGRGEHRPVAGAVHEIDTEAPFQPSQPL